jgi:predicted AAA+ superfamily ATPase
MNKESLLALLREQRENVDRAAPGIPREQAEALKPLVKLPHAVVVAGLRRCGKSTLLAQFVRAAHGDLFYYVNFEDERFLSFTAGDFGTLHQALLELGGERKVFLLDEIQNIPRWESFVRRLQDSGHKFYLTGSNARLLSRDLGTALTGRHVMVELFPFSFREFLAYKKQAVPGSLRSATTVERARLNRLAVDYLTWGGLPEYRLFERSEILSHLYEDILYRDVVPRLGLRDAKTLRELSLHLISHVGSLYSYNALKPLFHMGSPNTAKSYVEALENSYLFFSVPRFARSLKQQAVSPKKIYAVDNGIVGAVAFALSENRGHFLENAVFLHLRRRTKNVFYYKTASDREVDFFIPGKSEELIQVSTNISDAAVRERETRALWEAMEERQVRRALLLTTHETDAITHQGKTITIKPVLEWLLE